MEAVYFLTKHKNKVLNILILILFLFAAQRIYGIKLNEKRSLSFKKEQEIKKNQVLAQIVGLEKNISAYKKILRQKDSAYFIDKLSNLAKDSEVKIISIKPVREIAGGVYTRYPFGLSVSALGYHAIGKFISRIENSRDVFIVESIGISPNPAAAKEAQADKMKLELVVSAVFFKG